jgi:hypothetical protein
MRAAREQALFRKVNENIDDLVERFKVDDVAPLYVCECLNSDCHNAIPIPRDVYQQIRLNLNHFIVTPGHEELDVDEIVDRSHRWLVVRKRGVGANVAIQLADSRLDRDGAGGDAETADLLAARRLRHSD